MYDHKRQASMRTRYYCFIIQNTDSSLQHDSSKQFQILHVSLPNTKTNQNSIQEEIKSRLNSGNGCCYSVQNLLSSRLLSKNLKIKVYRTIILLVVLYRCETWSLTLWEEREMRVFENMVLRRIFGPRRDEVTK